MNLFAPRFLLRLFLLLLHLLSTTLSFCPAPLSTTTSTRNRRIMSTSSLANANQTSPSSPPSSNTDMTTAAAAAAAADADAKSAIDFLTLARGLKTTPRTGWIREEAGPQIESVADHSWRIALMSLVAATSNIQKNQSEDSNDGADGPSAAPPPPLFDSNKCIKMALVHDLAEAKVGDITPHCGVSDTDKHQQELSAMTQMTNHLQSSSSSLGLAGQEILDLWKEYEEGTSLEANLVKDMDKLEMTLQALEYEQDGKNQKSLDGFFDSTRDKWRTDIGRAWGEEIEARRPKRKETTAESSTLKEEEEEVDETTPQEPDAKKIKL